MPRRGEVGGDLVAFDGVLEGADLELELVGELDHVEHLVLAVAVHVDVALAFHDLDECLELEIAVRRRAFFLLVPALPSALVVARLEERFAQHREVAHARRGRLVARAVDPLRVLAHGHLHAGRRLLEYRGETAGFWLQLEHDALAADEVAAAREHLDCRHAAGDRAADRRILEVERVERAHLRGDRGGHLVAVGIGIDRGPRVDAEVRVRVDDAGHHPHAGGVDDLRVGRHGDAGAHRGDLAAANEDGASFDRRAATRR